MKIINKQITRNELKEMAQSTFGNFVKAVIDVEKEIMGIDAELHADEESLLLENGSKQENLWGLNLYPEKEGSDFVEFDSAINLRPAGGNKSRGVDSPEIRKKIIEIIHKLIE